MCYVRFCIPLLLLIEFEKSQESLNWFFTSLANFIFVKQHPNSLLHQFLEKDIFFFAFSSLLALSLLSIYVFLGSVSAVHRLYY